MWPFIMFMFIIYLLDIRLIFSDEWLLVDNIAVMQCDVYNWFVLNYELRR